MLHRNLIAGKWMEGAGVSQNINPSDARTLHPFAGDEIAVQHVGLQARP